MFHHYEVRLDMVAKNTTPKAPRSTRSAKNKAAAPEALQFNHASEFVDAGDLALEDLITSLGASDEIVEAAPPAVVGDEVLEIGIEAALPNAEIAPVEAAADDGDALSDLIASLNAPEAVAAAPAVVEMDASMLDDAVSSAEATEEMTRAAPSDAADAGDAPTGTESDVVPEKAVKAVKASKASKAPKALAAPRKFYTDKTERLKDKLGTSLGEYSVLTLADAGVTDAELAGVMENTMAIIKGMSSKASTWAVKFIEYLAGRKSSMSEVTARVFKLLDKDGFITTGNEGNLFKDLVSKPYSPGAARAMGGNNLAMMAALKIINPDGKGRFVPNPYSLLLMKAQSMLGAAPASAAELVSSTPAVVAESDEAAIEALELEEAIA